LSDDFTFRETPELNDQHRDFIDKDGSFFLGDPNRKLKQPVEGEDGDQAEPEPVEEEAEEDADGKSLKSDVTDKAEVEIPAKELVELDRVKYVVLAIENDCQIAPVGAFKMNA
jgi:hypothetical protein